MSDIKKHLKFRIRHSLAANLCILVIFLLNIVPSYIFYRTAYANVQVKNTTFENYYNMQHVNVLPYFIVIVMFVNIWLLYRNYRRHKERWLLLPTSRTSMVCADSIWILLVLLCMYLLQYVVYASMFHHFLKAVDDASIVNFMQTRNVLTSISRSNLAICYPTSLFAILRNGLLGACSVILVSFICAQLLVDRSKKWHIYIGSIVSVILIYIGAFTLPDAILCILLIFLTICLLKMTINCWNRQIGG